MPGSWQLCGIELSREGNPRALEVCFDTSDIIFSTVPAEVRLEREDIERYGNLMSLT